jgi:hypothetical protein
MAILDGDWSIIISIMIIRIYSPCFYMKLAELPGVVRDSIRN